MNRKTSSVELAIRELAPDVTDSEMRVLVSTAMGRYSSGDSIQNAVRHAVAEVQQHKVRGGQKHGSAARPRGY